MLDLYRYFESVTNKYNQLRFAIVYLQTKRVDEILNGMTSEEFIHYRDNADYYAVHTHGLMIRDMPYTNLSRSEHQNEFYIIEQLIKKKISKVGNI